MRKFHALCDQAGMNTAEASLRWLMHHSFLGAGDGIILGATKVHQLKGNVEFCRKGPLQDELVKAVDDLWEAVKDETAWR